MPYSSDLLEHARLLARVDRKGRPKQANLRRSVSASYYALFYFFLEEVGQIWGVRRQRNAFMRLMEHGRMRSAATKYQGLARNLAGRGKVSQEFARELIFVLSEFERVQAARHEADYDGNRTWTREETEVLTEEVRSVIETWTRLRKTELAEDFLLALLGGRP